MDTLLLVSILKVCIWIITYILKIPLSTIFYISDILVNIEIDTGVLMFVGSAVMLARMENKNK